MWFVPGGLPHVSGEFERIRLPTRSCSIGAQGERCPLEIIEATLAVVGSLSVGLGVGMLKRPYLEDALGPISIDIQRRIKQTLDPLNILNPGEFFMA